MTRCPICGSDDRGYFAILHGDFLCLHCYWWALDLLATPFTIPKLRLVRGEPA